VVCLDSSLWCAWTHRLGAVHSKQVCEMWCAWTHRCRRLFFMYAGRSRHGEPSYAVLACLGDGVGDVGDDKERYGWE